jgi:hypothetical protein
LRYTLDKQIYILYGIVSNELLIMNLLDAKTLNASSLVFKTSEIVKSKTGSTLDDFITSSAELILRMTDEIIKPILEKPKNPSMPQQQQLQQQKDKMPEYLSNPIHKHAQQKLIRNDEVDRIIEKRKAVALRKKILEYLRNAERPEETVSNANYPNNWEVIPRERPARKGKRGKFKNAKIMKVLAQKEHLLKGNLWMTHGYNPCHNEEAQMELEAISSDEDMGVTMTQSSGILSDIESEENFSSDGDTACSAKHKRDDPNDEENSRTEKKMKRTQDYKDK